MKLHLGFFPKCIQSRLCIVITLFYFDTFLSVFPNLDLIWRSLQEAAWLYFLYSFCCCCSCCFRSCSDLYGLYIYNHAQNAFFFKWLWLVLSCSWGRSLTYFQTWRNIFRQLYSWMVWQISHRVTGASGRWNKNAFLTSSNLAWLLHWWISSQSA